MRAASTYRGARRNAARGQVWGPQFYYSEHRAKVQRRPVEAQPWRPFAERQKLNEMVRRTKSRALPALVQHLSTMFGMMGRGIMTGPKRHQARSR